MEAKNRETCFAHRHMTAQEFGVWQYLINISHATGVLYFSGRAIAAQFIGLSKTTVYRVQKSLLKRGWLVMLKEPKKVAGKYTPGEFRVLSHNEWAERHPGICGHVAELQLQCNCTAIALSATPVPPAGLDQSHSSGFPVPPAGHNLITNLI